MSASRLTSAWPDLVGLGAFDARTTALDDPRPWPTEPALTQLGEALMNEILDLVLGSGLEDHATIIGGSLLGGLHLAVQRLERRADQSRDRLLSGLRDFDGGEVADLALDEARREGDAAATAAAALALVRDAAAGAWLCGTGERWTPARPKIGGARVTAARAEAAAWLRRRDGRSPVVVLRGAPTATAAEDGRRIFDALNWARGAWPEMVLATTGASGPERLGGSWAAQNGVDRVLMRPDFDRYGRAAPFRVNEELLKLEPVCVLILAGSLDPTHPGTRAFGPALNLHELALARGVNAIRIIRKTGQSGSGWPSGCVASAARQASGP